MSKKSLKAQFNKVQKIAANALYERRKLDKLIEKEYGFSYSDTDDDLIIDSLDYGTSEITFEDFTSRMNNYKNNHEQTGDYGIIP